MANKGKCDLTVDKDLICLSRVCTVREALNKEKGEMEPFTWREHNLQSVKLYFLYASVARHQCKQSPNFQAQNVDDWPEWFFSLLVDVLMYFTGQLAILMTLSDFQK